MFRVTLPFGQSFYATNRNLCKHLPSKNTQTLAKAPILSELWHKTSHPYSDSKTLHHNPISQTPKAKGQQSSRKKRKVVIIEPTVASFNTPAIQLANHNNLNATTSPGASALATGAFYDAAIPKAPKLAIHKATNEKTDEIAKSNPMPAEVIPPDFNLVPPPAPTNESIISLDKSPLMRKEEEPPMYGPYVTKNIIFTNSQYNLDIIATVLASEANHGLEKNACNLYLMNQENIKDAIQHFAKSKNPPVVLFLIDNFGEDFPAKQDLLSKVRLLTKNGLCVKINIPNHIDSKSEQNIKDIQHGNYEEIFFLLKSKQLTSSHWMLIKGEEYKVCTIEETGPDTFVICLSDNRKLEVDTKTLTCIFDDTVVDAYKYINVYKRRAIKIRSYVARLIKNAVTIHALPLLVSEEPLTHIVEKLRNIESMQSQNILTHRESVLAKVLDAINHFKNSHPLEESFIYKDPHAKTVDRYLRARGLRPQMSLNANIRYAHMSYPMSKKLHPTIVLAFTRRWETNIDNYFDQPLARAIQEHKSLKFFYIQIDDKKAVIAADERLNNEIVLKLADTFEEINIYLDARNKIQTININHEQSLSSNSITVSSCTFSHRIYLHQSGRKLESKDLMTKANILFFAERRFRAKKNRGTPLGAFFLAHITGKPKTVFITEGPEEAFTIASALNTESVRKAYNIQDANFAVIATTTLAHHIQFPLDTHKIVLVMDNDGESCIYSEKSKMLAILANKYDVYVTMARAVASMKKNDFNDILVHYGHAELEKALCLHVHCSEFILSKKHNIAQLAFNCALTKAKYKELSESASYHLSLAQAAYKNQDYDSALEHVEKGLNYSLNDSNPIKPELLYTKGNILKRLDKLHEALEAFTYAKYSCVIDNKFSLQLAQVIGDTHLLLGDEEWASLYYEQALSEVKNDLYNKAILLHKLGITLTNIAYFEASEEIWELIAKQKTYEDFWYIPNRSYRNIEAESFYVNCKLTSAITIAHKARIFFEKPDPEKAITLYTQADKKINNALGATCSENVKLCKRIADIKKKQGAIDALNKYISCIKMAMVITGADKNTMSHHYRNLIDEMVNSIAQIISRLPSEQQLTKWYDVCQDIGVRKADKEQIENKYFFQGQR